MSTLSSQYPIFSPCGASSSSSPASSSSAASSSSSVPTEPPAHSFCPCDSESGLLHGELRACGFVTSNGDPTPSFIERHELPPIGKIQKNNILSLLRSPFLTAVDKKPFRKPLKIGKLLLHIKKKYGKYIKEIALVGGGVPWILGDAYYGSTLASYGIKGADQKIPDYLKAELSTHPPDYDIRITMKEDHGGLLDLMKTEFIEYLIQMIPAEEGVNREVLIKDSGLTTFKHINDKENHFLIMGIGDRKTITAEFIFTCRLSTNNLAHTHGLKLPLDAFISTKLLKADGTDFESEKDAMLPIFPEGLKSKGHQAFFDRLLKKLNTDKLTNDRGWITLIHYLSLGYQITKPNLWKELATIFQSYCHDKSQSEYISDLIARCDMAHPTKSPIAPFFHALNASYTLAKSIPPEEITLLLRNVAHQCHLVDHHAHPGLVQLGKVINTEITPYASFALLELTAFLLEILQPSQQDPLGIRAKHVTTDEMFSLQLKFPTQHFPMYLQLKASPKHAFALLEEASRDIKQAKALNEMLSQLLPSPSLERNPKSSLLENWMQMGLDIEELTAQITPHLSSENPLIQTLSFYLTCAIHTLDPTTATEQALAEALPTILFNATNLHRRNHLLKTAVGVIGKNYADTIEALKPVMSSPLPHHIGDYYTAWIDGILKSDHFPQQYLAYHLWQQYRERISIESRITLANLLLEKLPISCTRFRLSAIDELITHDPSLSQNCLTAFQKTTALAIRTSKQFNKQYLTTVAETLKKIALSQTPDLHPPLGQRKNIARIIYSLISNNHPDLAEEILLLCSCETSTLLTQEQKKILWNTLLIEHFKGGASHWQEAHNIWVKAFDAGVIKETDSTINSPYSLVVLRVYDNLIKKNITQAIRGYTNLIQNGIEEQWEENVKNIFEMLWEQLAIGFVNSPKWSLSQGMLLIKDKQIQYLFRDQIHAKKISLLDAAHHCREALPPGLIQQIMTTCITQEILETLPRDKARIVSTQIVHLTDHAWDQSQADSHDFKKILAQTTPFLVEHLGQTEDHETLLKLIFQFHHHRINVKLDAKTVTGYFRTMHHVLQCGIKDSSLIYTLENTLQRLRESPVVRKMESEKLIFNTYLLLCDHLIKREEIEKGQKWIQQINALIPKGQYHHLVNRCTRWFTIWKSVHQFDVILKVLQSTKIYQEQDALLHELFSPDFLSAKPYGCVYYLLNNSLATRHKEKTEVLIKILLGSDIKGYKAQNLILRLLGDGEVTNTALWLDCYKRFIDDNNKTFNRKILRALRTATRKGLFAENPKHKVQCWDICLQTPGVVTKTEAIQWIKNDQELRGVFAEEEDQTGLLHVYYYLLKITLTNLFHDDKHVTELINIVPVMRERINTFIDPIKYNDMLWLLDCIIIDNLAGWFEAPKFCWVLKYIIQRLESTPDEKLPKKTAHIFCGLVTESDKFVTLYETKDVIPSIVDFIQYAQRRFEKKNWFLTLVREMALCKTEEIQKHSFILLSQWAEKQVDPDAIRKLTISEFIDNKKRLLKCLLDITTVGNRKNITEIINLLDNKPINVLLPVGERSTLYYKLGCRQFIRANHAYDDTVFATTRCKGKVKKRRQQVNKAEMEWAIDLGISIYSETGERQNIQEKYRNRVIGVLIGYLETYQDIRFFTEKLLHFLQVVESHPFLPYTDNSYLNHLSFVIQLLKNHPSDPNLQRPVIMTIYNCLDKVIDIEKEKGDKNINAVYTLVNNFIFEPVPHDLPDFNLHSILSKKIVEKFEAYIEDQTFIKQVKIFRTYLSIKEVFRPRMPKVEITLVDDIDTLIQVFYRMVNTKSPYSILKVLELLDRHQIYFWETGDSKCEIIFMQIILILQQNPVIHYRDTLILTKCREGIKSYAEYLVKTGTEENLITVQRLCNEMNALYLNQAFFYTGHDTKKILLLLDGSFFLEEVMRIGVYNNATNYYFNKCEQVQEQLAQLFYSTHCTEDYFQHAVFLIRDTVKYMGHLDPYQQERRATLMSKWLREGVKYYSREHAARALDVLRDPNSLVIFQDHMDIFEAINTHLMSMFPKGVKGIIFQQVTPHEPSKASSSSSSLSQIE